MNVAYRRSSIAEFDRAILLGGFWETTVHPLLSQKGFILYLSNEIRILHKKNFGFACLRVSDFCIPGIIPGHDFAKLTPRPAGLCAG
jgi:hypothetical protein